MMTKYDDVATFERHRDALGLKSMALATFAMVTATAREMPGPPG